MIIDASSVPSGELIEADICIIGAGPAGLSVARRFDRTNRRVFVLESGGEHPDDDSRLLGAGEVVGHPYFPLSEARARALGGSSYIWEEWFRARPLDPIDLRHRRWVPHSGWPIEEAELQPFYPDVQASLGLGPWVYEPDGWPENGRGFPFAPGERLAPTVFRYSNTADFTTVRSELDASSNVCLVLRAQALEIVPAEEPHRIDHVVASSALPQTFQVRARIFVLAAGGFDNPRLLLLSRSRTPAGLGNEHDQVGRYFMEHPVVRRGIFVPRQGAPIPNLAPFLQHERDGHSVRLALVPTPRSMEQQGILNGMILLAPVGSIEASESYRSMAALKKGFTGAGTGGEPPLGHLLNLLMHPVEDTKVLKALRTGHLGPRVHRLSITVEQAPDPCSRVTLGRRRDKFGQPVVALDWRMGDLEHRSMRILQEMLDAEMRDRGLGHVEGLLGDEFPHRQLRGEWHQMGTTRMSRDPKKGVVDRDCRVHGLHNLYVVGASVFPTVGYANPTLTIVALSLRLADHLSKELEGQPALGPLW